MKRFIPPLLLLAALAASYAPVFKAPFLFDDVQNIVRNRAARPAAFSVSAIEKALTEGPARTRPISQLSFALGHLVHGPSPAGHHAVNVAIHFAAAWLFCLLLIELTPLLRLLPADRPELAAVLGWVGAALWALSPLQTQAVSYAVQRMTSLSALLVFAALLFYVRWRKGGGFRPLAAAGASFLLALGSKETAVCAPFLALLIELTVFRRHPGRRAAAALAAAFSLCVLAGAVYIAAKTGEGVHLVRGLEDGRYPFKDFGPYTRVLSQGRVFLFYGSLLFFPLPSRLCLEHDLAASTSLFAPAATLPALLLSLGLLAYGLRVLRKRPALSLALLWFFASLALESGPLNIELVFEHRLYLPGSLPLGLLALWTAGRFSPKTFRAAAVPLLALLAFLTFQRNLAWSERRAFYEDCAAKNPGSPRAVYNLSLLENMSGGWGEAEKGFRRALSLKPGYVDAHLALGSLYLRTGRPAEALRLIDDGLARRARNTALLRSKTEILLALGETGRAEGIVREILDDRPKDVRARALLVKILLKKDLREAEKTARRGTLLSPEKGEAWGILGNVLQKEGEYEEAEEAYGKALDLAPDYAVAWYNLGNLFLRTGRPGRAEKAYEKAIARSPALAGARHNLALALHELGRKEEAAIEMRKAAELGAPLGAEERRVFLGEE